MRVVALISGGKDSTFNMMQCIAEGHEIVALANIYPHSNTEIDSYMYQSVGHEAIVLIAEAMDLPLFRKETLGLSNQLGRHYEPTENDEVEDLFQLLKDVKNKVEYDAVSVGAILSDYQRIRVENVCIRLGLTPLAYLWQRNQEELLDEMIKCEIDAVIIKVAALGLDPSKHLGRSLSLLQPHLLAMHDKYALNVCGEGGEYETLTLDCPLFKSRIIIEHSEIVLHSNDSIAPVGFLVLGGLHLELKLPALDLQSRLAGLPLKGGLDYILFNTSIDDDTEDKIVANVDTEDDGKTYNQECVSSRSGEGWLWIGGIQGSSSDPYEAMKEAMSVLKSTLEKYNQTSKDVCSISMFINNMSHYLDMNRVYVEMFNHPNPPSRACVEVPFGRACPVRIEALSWKDTGNSMGDGPIERRTMHVQSRSHWAPANIGPYSQAVKIGDFIHLAGQIGLVPSSLELVSGGIKSQCLLTLRHVERLLAAVDHNINLRDVVQAICYVTNASYIESARKLWEEKTNNSIVEYVVVTALPKNALVEWHVWAHRHNSQFEYEEKGKCVNGIAVSVLRRVDYVNSVGAIVCRVENPDDLLFEETMFIECINYAVEKLKQGHENDSSSVYSLKIFYPVSKNINTPLFSKFVNEYFANTSIVYTVIPVISLKSRQTVLSICGVRNQ